MPRLEPKRPGATCKVSEAMQNAGSHGHRKRPSTPGIERISELGRRGSSGNRNPGKESEDFFLIPS